MTNDEIKIRQLLKRFMDGKTTVEEEEQIGKWFREHPKVSDDLETYRQMFAWFDEGMPQSRETRKTRSASETRKDSNSPWLIAASIAAIAAISATIFFLQRPATTQPSHPQIAAITDSIHKPEIQKDSLPSESMEPQQSPETMEPQHNTETTKKAIKRSYYRHKFSPAPPKPLIALSDSMLKEGERLVDLELAKMEAEQQEALRQYELNVTATDSIFTAILQDNEEIY